MARIRTLKPEFPQSESIGRLSRSARLLYVNLITTVDDAGRARGSSRMLASLLYPYDNDAPGLIEDWLQELEQEGCARRYEFEGSTYIDLPNFLKHQKIDKPSQSRLPKFEDGSRVVAKPREVSATDLVPVSSTSTVDQRTMDLLPAASQPEPKRTTKVSRTRKTANVNLPPDWVPSDEEWKYATSLGFTADAIERQALEFTDHAKRVDRRCADWTAAWRVDLPTFGRPTNATRGISDRTSLAHASGDRTGFDEFLNGADRHG